MQNMLIKVISRSKISPDRMTRDGKVKFVSDLFDEGFFMFNGSVAVVAEAMNVSEPTAYRYLKKVKKENNNNKESSSI
jgi:predicted transcriptional regulator YheO